MSKHQKVHTFLRHNPMGVLSTVSKDGKPWGSAIYYVVDEDFKFYFVTRVETHKYHNLDANPFAAITVADNDSQTTVQVSGEVFKLPLEQYMDIVFHKLAHLKPKEDHSWMPPMSRLRKGNYMPLYMVPEHLQFADFKHVKSGIHKDYIEVVIPE